MASSSSSQPTNPVTQNKLETLKNREEWANQLAISTAGEIDEQEEKLAELKKLPPTIENTKERLLLTNNIKTSAQLLRSLLYLLPLLNDKIEETRSSIMDRSLLLHLVSEQGSIEGRVSESVSRKGVVSLDRLVRVEKRLTGEVRKNERKDPTK